MVSAHRTLFVVALFALTATLSLKAQTPAKTSGSDARSSQAYAELLLKKTETQAELEVLAAEYTDDYPKVVEGRYAIEAIEKERTRLLALKPAEVGKLTAALGKLIVRKVDLEVELWALRRTLQEAHPDVKRAKRKVEIFEAAIKEILG